MSRKPSGQCYLCGKWSNSLSRDHIPAKCLAPKNRNTDFLYAPACKDCNQAYSHEESKLRDFLAILCAKTGIAAADDAFEAFQRNVQRNEIGRAGTPHKDLSRIVNGIKMLELHSPGGIYLGTVPSLSRSNEIDMEGILIKVARGLHWAHYKTVIPDYYQMAALPWMQNVP